MKKIFILTTFIFASVLYAEGGDIYASRCSSCHGSHGEKSALNKSKAIGGQSAALSIKQIQAYKSGSLNQYGMGATMKNMVKSLNDNEIAEVADFISKLK
ncbi:MAG: c-type cytochrome [Epsilonproteobacteria bacterium]|nr:c-type cytochrome [Campylobacterota bacterium]